MNTEDNKELDADGIDRRGFLKCMAWAGTGVVYSLSGGVLSSFGLMDLIDPRKAVTATAAVKNSSFNFVQISDSHIGFAKDANKDVIGTLQLAVDKINATGSNPAFLLHTGDLSHLSDPAEFDAMDQVLTGLHTQEKFFVPGEHDVLVENGKSYYERYAKKTRGNGWYSFDHGGVHVIGLNNVREVADGGLGKLGDDQLNWLKRDVAHLPSSTPIVVFAHVPLWMVYPKWSWGTEDGATALGFLKRFGSVTVLNGHIHQTLQKVEGNITFHTAMSTAFPQPQPGKAEKPGPMKVPADRLRSVLGLTQVSYAEGTSPLAIIDSSLANGDAHAS